MPPELELGAPAPDFDVTLFDGGQMRLSDLAGQVVVLNFWASWCPPCRDEMPSFEQAWLAARDDGVVFVGLATGDIEADARAFADHVGVTYPLGLDLDGAVADRYLIRVMPTTYFIDRDGLLQRKLSGYVNQGVLKVFLAGQTGQPAPTDDARPVAAQSPAGFKPARVVVPMAQSPAIPVGFKPARVVVPMAQSPAVPVGAGFKPARVVVPMAQSPAVPVGAGFKPARVVVPMAQSPAVPVGAGFKPARVVVSAAQSPAVPVGAGFKPARVVVPMAQSPATPVGAGFKPARVVVSAAQSPAVPVGAGFKPARVVVPMAQSPATPVGAGFKPARVVVPMAQSPATPVARCLAG